MKTQVVLILAGLAWLFMSFWLEPLYPLGSPAWLGMTFVVLALAVIIIFWRTLQRFTLAMSTVVGLITFIGVGALSGAGVWLLIRAIPSEVGEATQTDQSISTEEPTAQTDPQTPLDDLGQLTVLQIKQRVIELTNRMKTFDSGRKEEKDRLISNKPVITGTEEEKNEQHRKWYSEFSAAETAAKTYFNNYLRPEALALESEIRKRVGRFSSDDTGRPFALKDGMLAGTNPIVEVVEYLNELARELH